MAETPRVGILSPGDMGAGIGSRLHAHGAEVYTCLAGRSELTKLRAQEAGFIDTASLDELVSKVDIVLSVLVPAEATAIAESVAAAMQRTGAHPAFVECNAIAPQTVREIEKLITATGGAFIDAGIIGGPPRPDRAGARVHCSGPELAPLLALKDYGLDVREVGPEVGQASALKMLFAASTKGTTALWTEILVAARRFNLEPQLLGEWGPNNATARDEMAGLPSMPRRARRWVGEMEEIAATFAAIGMTPKMLEGSADMYRFVGGTSLGDLTSRDANPSLDAMLQQLADALGEREGSVRP